MLCSNCAYKGSAEGECQICVRNPLLTSTKFVPRVFKDEYIATPIDMFISPAHLIILKKERDKRDRFVPTYPGVDPIPYTPPIYTGVTNSNSAGDMSFVGGTVSTINVTCGTLNLANWATNGISSNGTDVWITSVATDWNYAPISAYPRQVTGNKVEKVEEKKKEVDTKVLLEGLDGVETDEVG